MADDGMQQAAPATRTPPCCLSRDFCAMTATINPVDDELILFSEAARKLPASPGYTTVYRWHKRGNRSISGAAVRLDAVNTPRGLATTLDAYRRFVEALNG